MGPGVTCANTKPKIRAEVDSIDVRFSPYHIIYYVYIYIWYTYIYIYTFPILDQFLPLQHVAGFKRDLRTTLESPGNLPPCHSWTQGRRPRAIMAGSRMEWFQDEIPCISQIWMYRSIFISECHWFFFRILSYSIFISILYTCHSSIISGWWFRTFFWFFHMTWECHHPNWLSYFFRGVGIPTTRSIDYP